MRVKSPRLQRHNKTLRLTKGYRMTRNRLYKVASEAAMHAGQYAYAGRKIRRRDLRSLWIVRLSAALIPLNISYSKFIAGLKKAKIELDRKILSDLAITDPDTFKLIAEKAK